MARSAPIPPIRRRAPLLAALLTAALLLGAKAEDRSEEIATLAPEFQQWLAQVELLIQEDELDYFLSLTEDFRRRAFIDEFWRVRDPDPDTPYNELKRRWTARVDQALEDYGTLEDDRAQMLLTNGEPGRFVLPNGRVMSRCWHRTVELEIWFYGGSERTSQRFVVIFFRPEWRPGDPYRAWYGFEDLRAYKRRRLPSTNPADFCEGDILVGAQRFVQREIGYAAMLQDLMEPEKPASSEWVATFDANTTEVPPEAETFDAELALDFPGRNQSRTAVQGVVSVEPRAAAAQQVTGESVYRFLLLGEVVRDDRLLEQFRYRFEVPAPKDPQARIPLVFQRYLRPGEVDLRLRVEDLFGRRYAYLRRPVEVPSPGGLRSVRPAPDAEIFRLLSEANAAAERGQTTLRLVPPPEGRIQLGGYRFNTVTTGEIDRVEFLLNGTPVLTKRRPPFSVELNLGSVAATHRLRAVAYDGEGDEVATDELLVNRGGQRFRVRLSEPRSDRTYRGSLSAVVQVEVPDGERLERVEIFLDERLVATLYQPPFVQPILLEDDGLAYVRAVAHLEDGLSTEDVVFINAPDYFEEIEVVYVELFASVYGRDGRPVSGLERGEFRIWEDGAEQQIRRFEFVRDLPIHAALLIDTSASMEEGLPTVIEAARTFVEDSLRPKDRLALFSFNARPEVEVRFSGDPEQTGAALAGLRARGTTALYDSLIYALHYFDGVKGQKALLLLSDGKDEASVFDLENALETARRAGVTIYVIGLKELARDRDAQKVLRRFADDTGGRSFFIEDESELAEIYRVIQEELRSQYLITYQSTSEKDPAEFRRIRVEVDRRGAEVRTLSGYYP